MAEKALRLCFECAEDCIDPSDDLMVQFLDSTAALKTVTVDGLSDQEKWAFFINIYHLMIMHAQVYWIVGPLPLCCPFEEISTAVIPVDRNDGGGVKYGCSWLQHLACEIFAGSWPIVVWP